MSDFEVCPVGTVARLAQVEAERDALRDEFERLKRTVALQEQTYLKHHGGSWGNCKYKAERDALRMQLVACGVVALANTPESAANAREMHPDYRSPSCDDVARAVDREMALRAERDALRVDAERYRWLASRASKDTAYDRHGNGALWSIGFFADDSRHGLGAAIDAAMKGGGNG